METNWGMFGGDAVDDALAALKEGGTFRGTVSTEMLPNAHQFIDMAVELAGKRKGRGKRIILPNENHHNRYG